MATRLRVSLAGVLLASMATAAHSAELTNAARPLMWSGVVELGAGPIGEVPECATGCQRFDLMVALPPAVWVKPGGVEVAIRWEGRTLADNLKLYVYRDGSLVAKSDGIIATTQSVLIPNAENGTYQIYAVFDPEGALSSTIAYDGSAEVEYAPQPHPARDLLPDLEVRPQRNLGFDPGGIFFDEISLEHPTCYESEVEEDNAQLCLRFDQIFANIGEGSMELRFRLPAGEYPPAATAMQRIYSTDPFNAFREQTAGDMEFHEAHGHYHFASFGLSSLWRVDAFGRVIGDAPVRQSAAHRRVNTTLARTGRKVSFCLADIHIDSWGKKGDGPRTYNAPDCLFPASTEDGLDEYVQGITNGWADVYDWYLPDQYIDVAGLSDGRYLLQTVADPENRLIEANEGNNCGAVYLQLSDLASAPAATLIGPAARCAGSPD